MHTHRTLKKSLFASLLLFAAWPAHSALQGRNLDNNTATFEAYYDTALNITWLADANYAQTSNYAAANAQGRMTWDEATTWADNLVLGGYSEWRLPTMVDTGVSGCDLSFSGGTDCGYNVQTKDTGRRNGVVYSEMAHLYYETLGNKAYCPPGDASCSVAQPGWDLKNTGPFSNFQPNVYWFGVEYAPDTNRAWRFGTITGYQGGIDKDGEFLAWAVRSGDIAATVVPEPQTYALALAGVAITLLTSRVRKARPGLRAALPL